jgi:hypothetical protein
MGSATFFCGATMQTIMGRILSSHSNVSQAEAFSAAFWVLLVAAILAAVAGMFLHETYGQDDAK